MNKEQNTITFDITSIVAAEAAEANEAANAFGFNSVGFGFNSVGFGFNSVAL